jgi:hypothetical protein
MNSRVSSLISFSLCAAFIGGCASKDSSHDSASQSTPTIVSEISITPKGTPNFTSKAAGFSIYFPVKPTEKRMPRASEWGDSEMFMYQSETEPVTYLIITTTIPPKVDTSNPIHFIDSVQQGMAEATKAKVEKIRDVSLDGTPGREFRTTMHEGAAHARGYIYFTPKVTYQVTAIGAKEELQSQQAQIEKVLGSFRLVS